MSQPSKSITELLNGVTESIKGVVPIPSEKGKLKKAGNELENVDVAVIIGVVGGFKGRLIFHGSNEVFGKIGESMFGMPLEGDMLKSFCGELSNMIMGSTCSYIEKLEIPIDITPPTVVTGNSDIYSSDKGLTLYYIFENTGEMKVSVLLEEKQ